MIKEYVQKMSYIFFQCWHFSKGNVLSYVLISRLLLGIHSCKREPPIPEKVN
jgi:cytochrome b561